MRVVFARDLMRFCLLMLLLICPVDAPTQQSSTIPQITATDEPASLMLRTTTRNVVLDIVVVDRSGRPVRNLKEDDFIIKEDKQPQAAHLLSGPTGETGTREAPRTRNLILLDEANVRFLDLARARERLAKYFESDSALGRSFALMTMSPTRTTLVQDFTDDTGKLAAAVRAMPAVMPLSPADNFVDQERALESLQRSVGVIETIAHALSGSQDHVNLLWITSGFPTLSLIGSSGEIQFSYEEVMRHASNLYLNARMTIYTIDSSGVQIIDSLPDHRQPGTPAGAAGSFLREGGGGVSDGDQIAAQQDHMTSNQAVTQDLLGNIDARTGGRAFANQNFIDLPLARAVEDGSNVYSFAYKPSNGNFNGEFRTLSVRMRRLDLFARTREGYYATDETKPPTEEVRRAQLTSALDNPLPYHGLQVTGTLVPSRTGHVLEVRVSANGVEWRGDEKATRVTQSIALAGYTAKDKPAGSQQWRVTIARTDADRKSELVYRLPVRDVPGAVRHRVVVADDPGLRIGTAEVASVPLAAQPE